MNSDGLQSWYTNVLENKQLMKELKQSVNNYLLLYGSGSAQEVCSALEIHPAFESEVQEFIEEWQGA